MFSARSTMTRQKSLIEETALEGQLFAMLNPVQASPEFVSSLKTRLTSVPSISVERNANMAAVLVIGLGLFAGVFMAWAVFYLRSLLGKKSA